MQNHTLAEKYESQWQGRVKREGDEDFVHYERNWVLPGFFRKGEKVLDLASGNSIVGQYLTQNLDCSVTALDISETAIREAKKRGIDGRVGSVEEKLPFKTGSYDVVFWGDNIEHVFNVENILREIKRVLKKGGRVIISTPNQAYWRYRWYMFVNGALPKTEGEDNKPWEWTHIRFFNRNIMEQLFEQTGFREEKFVGVSRRQLDRIMLPFSQELFGMIMVVGAVKK